MFSSYKHRRDCFPQSTLYAALQGAAHNALEQRFPRTHSHLCQFLLQQQYLGWKKRLPLACCTQPLLSEVGEPNTTAPVRLDQGSSAAAAQLEHLPQPKWGDGKGKGQSHCPQFRARKTGLGAIKQFRMIGESVWHFTYSTCRTHCIQRQYHPNIPFFPPQKTRKSSSLPPQCHRTGAHSKKMVAAT